MIEDNDLVPNLLRNDSGLTRVTQGYLGQTVLNKISKHNLQDDELVSVIAKSNELLQSIITKYTAKKEELIDEKIQNEINALVFKSNYTEDRFKIQTFVDKIDVLIVKVATQKNELASYRNELKEIIRLTTPNDSNQQRIIDLGGIIQFLDLKILKIENDVESARNQINSLNKCFDVTFFHLKESIEKNTSESLYLDVMFKLSQLKLVNYQYKLGVFVAGAISILLGIYNLIASVAFWKKDIVHEVGYTSGSELSFLSPIFSIVGFIVLLLAVFQLFQIARNAHDNVNSGSRILSVCMLFGIAFVSNLFSTFLSVGDVETKVVGVATYQLLNIGFGGGLIHLALGVALIVWGMKKKRNINGLTEKQNELHRLCKGK